MPQATVRLTMAQALVRYLAGQQTEVDTGVVPLFAGVWAIFGHGNVAGLGEALVDVQTELPTYRAHNEQAMALAAIAFAKASRRRRMMACTTSIGPGATNMVTAAAVAHVNRLPVLLLPGDVYASRRPDPVLQQVEDFGDGTISANDCFRPVSRYFDRITRPEQIVPALIRALNVLTDPAECGPVTLALCQDVQAEAWDYPVSFFTPRIWRQRRTRPDVTELQTAVRLLRHSAKPLVIAGGGVLYSDADDALRAMIEQFSIPVTVTQAGKSCIPDDHPLCLGAIGVTGTAAANACAAEADVILAIGTRLQDFSTGSWSLFENGERRLIGLNVAAFDAGKHAACPLIGDARAGIEELSEALREWSTPQAWSQRALEEKLKWMATARRFTEAATTNLPTDAQVLGAVQRAGQTCDVVVCAAGGLPGELHKLWVAKQSLGYHVEYGYSCMGYEIAGGLGVKMALPDREVIVLVGDGSYLMMNSEIATSVMLGLRLTIVVLDNGGFGCINRLQQECGGVPFNNLLKDTRHVEMPVIDFAAHAASLGAESCAVGNLSDLEEALRNARGAKRTRVIVIRTDPAGTTDAGGHWWDVAVAEVSTRPAVAEARRLYEAGMLKQRIGD